MCRLAHWDTLSGSGPRVEKPLDELHAISGYSFLFLTPLRTRLFSSTFDRSNSTVGRSFLVSKSCIHDVGSVGNMLYSYSVDGVMVVDASEPNFAARLFAPSSPECSTLDAPWRPECRTCWPRLEVRIP